MGCARILRGLGGIGTVYLIGYWSERVRSCRRCSLFRALSKKQLYYQPNTTVKLNYSRPTPASKQEKNISYMESKISKEATNQREGGKNWEQKPHVKKGKSTFPFIAKPILLLSSVFHICLNLRGEEKNLSGLNVDYLCVCERERQRDWRMCVFFCFLFLWIS